MASSYEAHPDLQQELLQEMSLAVWQALSNFKGDSSLKTYVLRVAHNKAVTHVAYQVKQPKSESYCETDMPLPSPQTTAEHRIVKQDEVKQLLAAVRQLPLQPRQIITMSMEGLSYQEIAEVCGITASNVGAIINRAKKTLLEQMHHDG